MQMSAARATRPAVAVPARPQVVAVQAKTPPKINSPPVARPAVAQQLGTPKPAAAGRPAVPVEAKTDDLLSLFGDGAGAPRAAPAKTQTQAQAQTSSAAAPAATPAAKPAQPAADDLLSMFQ